MIFLPIKAKKPLVREPVPVLRSHKVIELIRKRGGALPGRRVKPVPGAKIGQARLRALRNMTVVVAKVLPEPISRSAELKIAYAMLRWKESKRAFKTEQNPPGEIKIERIHVGELGDQIHIWVRFEGEDRWYGGEGAIDVDIYIPAAEWRKVQPALGTVKKSTRPPTQTQLIQFAKRQADASVP